MLLLHMATVRGSVGVTSKEYLMHYGIIRMYNYIIIQGIFH